jgi:glycosyltransferase involved in cell wall biosynthesis
MKISIITQCFNREDKIAETIESVLSQNYPDLEYIVIDDGSTDKSWEIISRYKDRLAHCERIEGKRSSPVEAINRGLSLATGDIVTWINSKNILMPKSLFTIAEVFSKYPEIEWLTGLGLTIDGDGKVIYVVPVRQDRYDYLIGSWANIQQESTFWRRSLWERTKARLDENEVAFDVHLWCHYFFPNATLYHLNTIVGAYRKSSTAFSSVRRGEFLASVKKAREYLRQSVPARILFLAEIYRLLRRLKFILRNIPDRAYQYIPILNRLSHRAVRFKGIENDKGVLERYQRNPFRFIFPW